MKAEDRAECRSKSIIDAFTKWGGVEVPSELTQFMGE